MREFGRAFVGADQIVLTDIYSAGEDAIPGVTVDALAAAVRTATPARVRVVKKLDDLTDALVQVAEPGDVVLTLGAGSIGSVSSKLVEALERKALERKGREA